MYQGWHSFGGDPGMGALGLPWGGVIMVLGVIGLLVFAFVAFARMGRASPLFLGSRKYFDETLGVHYTE